MYGYSYDYSDKSMDEILESARFDINNLFNEMDLMIIKANYRYLRENGEEMSPGQQAKVAGEVKEGILKKVWNIIRTPDRVVGDWIGNWIVKKLNHEEDYTVEELGYMERGFDILAKDKTIKFRWDYLITPALILHKPIISDVPAKTLMKITPNDADYKDKFIACNNKVRKTFARMDDGRDLPVMIKKQDLITYVKNEKNIIRSNTTKLYETIEQLQTLFNKKTAPKDFLRLSAITAEDIVLTFSRFIKDTNTYFNTVAKTCIRLGKQAAKEEMYTSSTNESYMFDTMFDDTFDDLYY